MVLNNQAAAQTKRDVKKAKKQAELRRELDAINQQAEIEKMENDLKMTKLRQEKAAKEREGVTIELPCVDQSYDDANYFRELGSSVHTGNNIQSARQAALVAAQEMIKQKMSQFVQGFTKSYFGMRAGSASTDDIERKAQNEFNAVIEGMLNNTEKLCEKMRTEGDGLDHMYITVQISKKEFLNKCKDALSKDEQLKIDFDAAQFDKIAKEEMQKMLDAKKEAGY